MKKSATEAHRLLVETYGEAALSKRSCREWFQKFKNGEFDIEDKERSGRPKVYKDLEFECPIFDKKRRKLICTPDSTLCNAFFASFYECLVTLANRVIFGMWIFTILGRQNSWTRQKLSRLGWKVMLHPRYSSDLHH